MAWWLANALDTIQYNLTNAHNTPALLLLVPAARFYHSRVLGYYRQQELHVPFLVALEMMLEVCMQIIEGMGIYSNHLARRHDGLPDTPKWWWSSTARYVHFLKNGGLLRITTV